MADAYAMLAICWFSVASTLATVAGVDAQHRAHGLAGSTDVAIPIMRHAEIDPGIDKPRRQSGGDVECLYGAVQKPTGEIGDAERVMALRHGTAAQTAFARSLDGAGYIAKRQQGPRQVQQRRRIVRQQRLAGAEQRCCLRVASGGLKAYGVVQPRPWVVGDEVERTRQQIERLSWRAKAQAAQSEDPQRG
jgi:hypothetical protein